MLGWTADYANDPNNDFELIVEILYNDLDIGVIHEGKDGLELKWYEHQEAISVPLEWFANLINKVRVELPAASNRVKEKDNEKEEL